MSAYVVFDIDVHDVDAYQAYRRLGAPTVAAYGGRFLVRGAEVETLEGDWAPKRVVVLEFESAERAREWYRSEGYQAAKRLREPAARTLGILADGYVPAAGDPR
ncbi:DUF1330 domain-containing protein [Burkholderia cepacia]|uniref:DUF1330 domain-containing protein n=1 Tax=Burkholderia cepacia TaxID=292 RepID=A0A2S8ISV7_BURCE|nr:MULTISPECIES: DUF1330 domain-containing protein [Burkholderia]EKS9887735.1 DUF1330 domain-containing protein [Burkholderia pyrrocinia]EKS9895226.1 DUF1330 domain-containing protein [Burkholderia pyrrocinia]EKS9907775.1 DUF1330 domain-containing protein [Burkholderia pyrrocinia]KFL53958.1 hypothetical protein JM78_10600 [Burkholderia pyrrocinia]PQP17840.1 DUF1330 domain-containing protein [Burkholderia cepacia]